MTITRRLLTLMETHPDWTDDQLMAASGCSETFLNMVRAHPNTRTLTLMRAGPRRRLIHLKVEPELGEWLEMEARRAGDDVTIEAITTAILRDAMAEGAA